MLVPGTWNTRILRKVIVRLAEQVVKELEYLSSEHFLAEGATDVPDVAGGAEDEGNAVEVLDALRGFAIDHACAEVGHVYEGTDFGTPAAELEGCHFVLGGFECGAGVGTASWNIYGECCGDWEGC